MRVLHTGYGKSGNSWLYTIVRLALDSAGVEDRGFWREHPCHKPLADMGFQGLLEGAADVDCFDVTPHGLVYELGRTSAWAPILDLDDYTSRCRQLWTHAAATDQLQPVIDRVDRVVHIVRDVRDVAVSNAQYMFTPANVKHFPQYRKGHASPEAYLDANFQGIVHDWTECLYGYLRRLNNWPLHIVVYERLLAEFDDEFDRLLRFLGISLDAAQRAAIKERVSFGSMRSRNPEHVRAGTRNQWRQSLSPRQQDLADCVAGPLLRLLGYPTSHETDQMPLPGVPAAIDWKGWTERPWPQPDLRAFRYPDLVRIYRETLARAAADGVREVAGWGGDVCGRAMLDAAGAEGVSIAYFVDRDPALVGQSIGDVPIIAHDAVAERMPLRPFVIGSLGSVEVIQAEIRRRLHHLPELRVYAPIPGRQQLITAANHDQAPAAHGVAA